MTKMSHNELNNYKIKLSALTNVFQTKCLNICLYVWLDYIK
ncbi:hypothetical protein SAMN05421877_11318 [Sphingobacterium lactis]|uniref:Uncharacterized protein n=1 Tax=Sphingobacterium lactis TaxID=797291 RepID=A0A1H6C3R7_9SPHI|nr:hypothetical protein SAMN05421877_11318 [Sphingobacterium lactis]